MNASTPIAVAHEAAQQRYSVTVDGAVGHLDYERRGPVLRLVHTEMPSALEGRGLASRLVTAAFEDARRDGLKIEPVCTYVQAWVKRHPEVADLLA